MFISVMGLGSLVWLLIRSVPKPSRLQYPCQRAALINSLAFFSWLGAILGGSMLFHRLRPLTNKLIIVSVSSLLVVQAYQTYQVFQRGRVPLAIGQGAPSPVVWITNSSAANGYDQPWANKANQTVVNTMMDNAIKSLTGQATVVQAWTSIFTTHNSGPDYVNGENIVLKVNFNNSWDCDNNGCPIYQVTNAVLRQLVNDKNIPQANIAVYDTSRDFPSYFIQGVSSSFPNVRLNPDAGPNGACTVADNVLGAPFGCALSNAKYLINMPLLRVHGGAGVTLSFKNHLGSTSQPGNFHGGFFNTNPSTNSLVRLNQHPFIRAKTILIIDDALYGLTRGGPDGHPDLTPNSLFLSKDPVAIDSVMTDYLESVGACVDCTGNEPRIYLQAAAGVGLGNYATSCSGSCTFSYPNITLTRCNPTCPGNPTTTPGPSPTPTISPTPTSLPTPTNPPAPTPTLPGGIVNIANLGTGYRWFGNSNSTGTANQTAAAGINDGNATVDISLSNGDDSPNAYEGAGVIFTAIQSNLVKIDYVNGAYDASSDNGCFTANFQLQSSTDGTAWVNTNWAAAPTYPYNSTAGSQTYSFVGAPLNNIRGLRVVGQVHTGSNGSWQAYTREVKIFQAPSAPPSSPADFNQDGKVDIRDFYQFLPFFNQANTTYKLLAGTIVNIFDFSKMTGLLFK
jgi:hypothetical protein